MLFFYGTLLKIIVSRFRNFSLVWIQVHRIIWQSIPSVLFSGVFIGAILVLQFHTLLKQYGALALLGGIHVSTFLKEVGPLMISFLLAGQVGAEMSAELGTMRVTHQIDGVTCLGGDPMEYLVVPRFLGVILSNFLLCLLGLGIGILGSMIFSFSYGHIYYLEFMRSFPRFVSLRTFLEGGLKSFLYGHVIATIACFHGYYLYPLDARGIGQAVVSTAVWIQLGILMANFLINFLFHL